jgi:cytoskeletal protein RodZ
MSLTLGEKLRQAREERGFTVSEVSEQTRISSLYLESIENDDYSNLPGGIFNKGFVKSYAKFVGINEQEALLDYTRLISAVEGEDDGELKQYKPEIFTDEGGGRSMFPTFVVAVLILGAMTAAILFGVNYLRRQSETPVVNQASVTNANLNSNSAANTEANANKVPDNGAVPDMATLRVEFKALGEPVSLTATNDGKTSTSIVTPGAAATFEPKTSLKLSYSRSLANFVQLVINGKQIALPAAPLEPRRNAIAFEINSENLPQIWSSGSITSDVPAAIVEPSAANSSTPGAPRPTPAPRATVAAPPVETVPKTPLARPSASPKPPTMMGKPPTMTGKPPANRPQ